ncbi:hypothetical protein M408DRAFT_294465 [Serendipita vermifera MAFF 305830]|uniref:Sfi1 spindle body domain-containing protein n=1 Tax=Serendipita vermifera MAFF 305830 TaxID=933852 RepID=A0A0C3BFE9_SERVB|nr:hypothetical protein M408DRAFT_294465 [Serendipita vermifera MAFF 305830]
MSHRKAIAPIEPSDKRKPAPSSASIISSVATSSSSGTNLQPFEGLSPPEVAFIDAIIRRVPSHVTNFVPVFKAYQDEFEARGQSATNDQFYYNLLLKLGMIRADNWVERWRIVCDHWGYTVASPQHFLPDQSSDDEDEGGRALHENTPKQRDIVRHVDYDAVDGEDDAFTLHSQPESERYPTETVPPPSYHSRKPIEPIKRQLGRPSLQTEGIASSSRAPRSQPKVATSATERRRSSSIRRQQEDITTSKEVEDQPVVATPPSYASKPRSRRNSARITSQEVVEAQQEQRQNRDDAETWRLIQMERDADMFRREFLLSCCLDVWIKGLRWVEETSTQLDNARTAFLLHSVLTRWRSKSAAAIEETRRASLVDRVRLMNSALRTWRLRAWTERRKRWAEGMRDKMTQMQRVVEKRILNEFLEEWKRAHQLIAASRRHDATLLHKALRQWNRRLHRVVDLSHQGNQLVKHTDEIVLERALMTWKRRVHVSVASKIVQERAAERIMANTLRVWLQKTNVYAIASGFSDARILREAVQKWIRRRARIQHLERRAIAHHNKPLVRAVFRIWLIQARLQRYEALRQQRQKISVLRLWIRRVQDNHAKEDLALQFSRKVDKNLASQYLRAWTGRLAARRRLERRAQRAFEATAKAKALIQWRGVMWVHAKQVKQAKLARRLFLTRLAWGKWKEVIDARRREERKGALERKVLKKAWDAWKDKARSQKHLRRMEDVVRMAQEARLVKTVLREWTLRVVYLKDREYSVIEENRERVLRAFLARWKQKLDQQQENTSLMLSFQDVRREEYMRRVLNHWVQATRRKRSLLEREEELNRMVLSQVYDKWRDRYLENNLRPAELDVLLQSQTNLLFKMFRIWEARTPSIPAIRFRAYYTRLNALRAWKAAMPAAMKRKEARDHDRTVVLAKSLDKWREKYKTKVSLKAVARARYLRLPPAPAKQAANRMLLIKPRISTSTVPTRSYRSASPEREPPASRPVSFGSNPTGVKRPLHDRVGSGQSPPRAESSRAPSPTSTRASFQGFGLAGLAKRRPVFGAPSSSGIGGGGTEARKSPASADARSRSSWDGYGATRARARAAFASGRPSSVYQEPREDDND